MIWIGLGFLTLLVLLGALRWAAFARVGQIKALIGGLIAVALVLIAAVFLATGRVGISWPFLLAAWFASQRVRQGIGLMRFLRQLFGGRGPQAGTRAASTPPNGDMDVREACAVLGVDADADPDAIRAAHRRLIQQLHPDRGGSGYLAAKINQAKDVLLKRRRQ